MYALNYLVQFFILYCGLLLAVSQAKTFPALELQALIHDAPALYTLYTIYSSYYEGLSDYANHQSFKKPYENLGTVLHEMIHIASATHEGYFIEGIYYEPYLNPFAWPVLSNKMIQNAIPDSAQGMIYRYYILNTPDNGLGNIVDEINAYSQVLPFICLHEPESTKKQANNLIELLQIQDTYLRVLKTQFSKDYQTLQHSKESKGAMTTINQNAWTALQRCNTSFQPSIEIIQFLKSY